MTAPGPRRLTRSGKPRGRRPIALGGAALWIVLSTFVRAEESDVPECRDDAILIVDASGSMASTDTSGNISRIHRVREAVSEVVPNVAPFRDLGLMVYGGGATNGCGDIALKVPPGPNNAGPIIEALRDVLPNGRTPLTESVKRAAEALDYRTKAATVVLLTDGEESCGGDPCKLADRFRREGLRTRIHVVDYKLRVGSDWRGTFQSRCLAERTGGKYVPVNTTKELIDALRDTLGCNLVTGRPPRVATRPGRSPGLCPGTPPKG